MRGKELVLQLPLGEPFEEQSIRPEDLAFLARLKPPIENYQPLVLIQSLYEKPSGKNIANVTLQQPSVKVILFPNLGDFKNYRDNCKFMPKGIVVQVAKAQTPDLPYPQFQSLQKLVLEVLAKGRQPWQRRLWLVETERRNSLTAEERKKRKELLGKLSLVDSEVYWEKETGLVWVTGRPKKGKKPTDLNQKRYVGDIKNEVAARLENSGWHVVSWEEIDSRLRESKFPPGDLEKLKSGWGILVLAPCGGCLYRISAKGDIYQMTDCGEEHKEGITEVYEAISKAPVVLGRFMKTEIACGECGKIMDLARVIQQTKGSRVLILEELSCGGCGATVVNRFWCSNNQLKPQTN